MSGEKSQGKKGKYDLRNTATEQRNEDEMDTGKTTAGQDGGGGGSSSTVDRGPDVETVDSLRKVMSEVMTAGLATMQAELKKDLAEFRTCFREDMKQQMEEFKTEINQKLQDSSDRLDGTVQRIGEVEESLANMERWDIGVKDTLLQLLSDQQILQDKLTYMEGYSRRENIRIYSISEGAELAEEGGSTIKFVENLIRSELGDLGLGQNESLGIMRAHRVGPKPPATAPPRSMVIRFLQYTVKEKVLHAAWRKTPCVNGKRVFFDHDYADSVQKKRKEYAPIKKALLEKKIKFQTPMTRMRVELDTGIVVYNSALQAAEDLRKRGLDIGPIVPATKKKKSMTEEALTQLMPWEFVGSGRAKQGAKQHFQQQVRERLSEYRRTETGGTEELDLG